jgi:PAS domain S-box-containing protein
VILRDITERKRAEERLRAINKALQEGEDKYHELVELGGVAAFLLENKTGVILESNTAASEMYGYSHDEFLRLRSFDLSAEPEKTREVFQTHEQGSVVIPNREQRRKDGSIFIAEINTRFFTWKGRSVTVAALRDITERVSTLDALRQINRKMALLNSITRHDMLNQLLVMEGNLALIRMKAQDPVLMGHIEASAGEARNIREQIAFSKDYQEMGAKDRVWQDVEQIFLDIGRRLDMSGVDMSVDVGGLELLADPLLAKVFYNLVDNSLTHGVKVSRISVTSRRSPSTLHLILEDDGIGIPTEQKSRIFEKGFGLRTGLGLFLSKEILAISGMRIEEQGQPGKGASFVISVPQGHYRFDRANGEAKTKPAQDLVQAMTVNQGTEDLDAIRS